MTAPQQSDRFIPYSADDVAKMCMTENTLANYSDNQLLELYQLLSRQFGIEALSTVARLKQAYKFNDPDTDLRTPKLFDEKSQPQVFEDLLQSLLNQANFERISEQEIQDSLGSSSVFKLRLKVDFNPYEEVLIYYRGESKKSEELKMLMGLRTRTVEFNNFDRVFIYIRFKKAAHQKNNKVLLRLFQNVPKADLEMLFPETKVGLRPVDKLMIGIPALVSGVVVISTKLGATLVLLGSLLGFYLGWRSQPVTLDKAALLALGAGIGALAGYIWKQFSNFKNRKLKFAQTLTSNLYFKLLDTNAGVFHRIADNASEEELKESLLAYYFLLKAGKPTSMTDLDHSIQQWFLERWDCDLDFEVEDALAKLKRLGLASIQPASENNAQSDSLSLWQAVDMNAAKTLLSQQAGRI